MKATPSSPYPLLVLVCGKPGSGKSTLARRLDAADALGLPLLSRDAIKVGLVETHATSDTGPHRAVVETDTLRSTIVPLSFRVFYRTIGAWLRAGVSLIAECGFQRGRCESDLRPLTRLARAVIVQCDTAPEEARRRFVARERADPHSRPDRLTAIIERMDRDAFDWTRFDPPDLGVPTLRVDTTDGYDPSLEAIVAFCQGDHAIYTRYR